MKERTVNGMPINEVWQKLKAEFPSGVVKRHPTTKKEYIPVEKMEERLNEVVGMENWDFRLIAPVQICRFGPAGFESCVVSAELRIYDDEHRPIIRSTGGASDLIYPKDSDRPTSVANAVDSAVQDAFKRCIKRFGVNRMSNISGNMPERETQQILMKVTVLEPFIALPKGGAKALVSYKGEKFDLIIWKDRWEDIKKKYAAKFQIGNKVNEITFLGVKKEYHGKAQIEFISFPKRGAA